MTNIANQIAEALDPAKLKVPIVAATASLPLTHYLNKYLFNDWDFLAFLVIIVVIDTLTGLWKAWKLSQVSSSGWGRIITKTISYGLFLVTLHILGNHSEKAFVREVFDWATTAGYSALIVREAISIIENLDAIHPGIIPRWISKRLKSYEENGPGQNHPPQNNGDAQG